jgi:hypothetical protein
MADTQLDTFQIEDNAISTVEVQDLSLVDLDISDSADIAQSKIHNLESDLASKLDRTGGTATAPLFGVAPVNNLDAATKQYVDNQFQAVSGGTFALLVRKPNVSTFNAGSQIVTVTPYRILTEAQTVEVTTDQQITLNDSNLESGTVTWGSSYYLYATATGLKFSSTAPNVYKKHPTNNWAYLSFIKTRSGTNDIAPFVKTDNHFRYIDAINILDIASASGNYNLDCSAITPAHARIVFFGWHSESNSAYVKTSISSFGDGPSRSLLVDYRYTSGYPGAGGGNNQGSSLTSNIYGILFNQILYVNFAYADLKNQIWFEGFLD